MIYAYRHGWMIRMSPVIVFSGERVIGDLSCLEECAVVHTVEIQRLAFNKEVRSRDTDVQVSIPGSRTQIQRLLCSLIT